MRDRDTFDNLEGSGQPLAGLEIGMFPYYYESDGKVWGEDKRHISGPCIPHMILYEELLSMLCLRRTNFVIRNVVRIY